MPALWKEEVVMGKLENIIAWFDSGERGLSSEAIAFAALGRRSRLHHPLDPDDLRRCLLLLRMAPEASEGLSKLALFSAEWAALVRWWSILDILLKHEIGVDLPNRGAAPATFHLMHMLQGR